MDDRKRRLKGSAARDDFKHWHKQPPFPRSFYASDIDFALVSKRSGGRIIAILDYKQPGDRITFAETIAYNDLTKSGFSVYIITAPYHPEKELPFEEFTIQRYLGGDWKPEPPRVKLEMILEKVSVSEFIAWEKCIRA